MFCNFFYVQNFSLYFHLLLLPLQIYLFFIAIPFISTVTIQTIMFELYSIRFIFYLFCLNILIWEAKAFFYSKFRFSSIWTCY